MHALRLELEEVTFVEAASTDAQAASVDEVSMADKGLSVDGELTVETVSLVEMVRSVERKQKAVWARLETTMILHVLYAVAS